MITDIKEFCQLFYHMTSIPIHYHDFTTNQSHSFPSILSDLSIFRGTLHEFKNFEDSTQNPDYFISPSFSYFGWVRCETLDYAIILGPVFSVPTSDITLRNFMKEWAVSPEYRQEISQFLANTPAVSFNRFLYTLAHIHLCLNDQCIDIIRHFHLTDTHAIQELSGLHSDQVYESKENRNYHNTWHFEQEMLRYIQNGDTESLKNLLEHSSELAEGVMADDALRQRKNILVTTIALVMRSAITGGMDMEQAYQLADVYIQECERSQSVVHVANLEYSMLIDFSERVSQNKIPQGMSREIFDCIQYITHHINEPIQVTDVAAHIGRSRSYLSGHFKKELGFEISSFIMRCKLEEAKSLLTYSDKSLIEISNYLCFSSQSYFQNVFKKKYGMTPKRYRDQTRKV